MFGRVVTSTRGSTMNRVPFPTARRSIAPAGSSRTLFAVSTLRDMRPGPTSCSTATTRFSASTNTKSSGYRMPIVCTWVDGVIQSPSSEPRARVPSKPFIRAQWVLATRRRGTNSVPVAPSWSVRVSGSTRRSLSKKDSDEVLYPENGRPPDHDEEGGEDEERQREEHLDRE